MGAIKRVIASESAKVLIDDLRKDYGHILFHQSGGCCDGSQPMCFEEGDFKIGSSDVCLGTVYGAEFWMSKDQFEYWQFSELTLDVVKGRGSSFSLEIPRGVRFIVRSRIFSDDEYEHLEPVKELDD